jgi:hypothetical protein
LLRKLLLPHTAFIFELSQAMIANLWQTNPLNSAFSIREGIFSFLTLAA